MKKTILAILDFVIRFCCCINILATDTHPNIITLGNIDVVFATDSNFTENEKQFIANHILYGDTNTETYGLICNLFGHKTTTEVVVTTTHKVNDTRPRCLEECWEVTACSRCDYVETTRLSYGYKNCCPED